MKFVQLNENEYNTFAVNHEYANFLNSIYSGKKFTERNWNVYYIGVKEDDLLVGATLLVSTKIFMKYNYFYAPRGFLLDYNNKEIIKFMCDNIKLFAKEKNGLYLKIDPYVPYKQRDINGDLVENGFNNQDIVDTLISNGFEHKGFTVGYDDNTQCRWMSVLDLRNKTKEQILKEMNAQCRQNIKSAIKNNVKIRSLAYDELNILHDIVNKTSERRGFADIPLEQYQQQYRLFQEHANAYYVYLPLEEYIRRIEEEMKQEYATIKNANDILKENPHSKNSKNRLNTATAHVNALIKRKSEALELQKEYGDEVPLAASMFIFYGNEVIYLTSGSNDKLKKSKGPYALQWEMIQKAIDEGYSYYNFYGISGYFEKEQEGFGVFDFKRGFKADVVELIGDFEMPLNKKAYALYKTLKNIKNKIK